MRYGACAAAVRQNPHDFRPENATSGPAQASIATGEMSLNGAKSSISRPLNLSLRLPFGRALKEHLRDVEKGAATVSRNRPQQQIVPGIERRLRRQARQTDVSSLLDAKRIPDVIPLQEK